MLEKKGSDLIDMGFIRVRVNTDSKTGSELLLSVLRGKNSLLILRFEAESGKEIP